MRMSVRPQQRPKLHCRGQPAITISPTSCRGSRWREGLRAKLPSFSWAASPKPAYRVVNGGTGWRPHARGLQMTGTLGHNSDIRDLFLRVSEIFLAQSKAHRFRPSPKHMKRQTQTHAAKTDCNDA
jgi:hypothetical protein